MRSQCEFITTSFAQWAPAEKMMVKCWCDRIPELFEMVRVGFALKVVADGVFPCEGLFRLCFVPL